MPTYVYKCAKCDNKFEKIQRITEDSKAECPECKSYDCKRQIVASSFHLKGKGWYATDYPK